MKIKTINIDLQPLSQDDGTMTLAMVVKEDGASHAYSVSFFEDDLESNFDHIFNYAKDELRNRLLKNHNHDR
jgi:hypothetical protein